MTLKFENFVHIGVSSGMSSEEPIILGTRLGARFVAEFGSVADTKYAYPYLTDEQIQEAKSFVQALDR